MKKEITINGEAYKGFFTITSGPTQDRKGYQGIGTISYNGNFGKSFTFTTETPIPGVTPEDLILYGIPIEINENSDWISNNRKKLLDQRLIDFLKASEENNLGNIKLPTINLREYSKSGYLKYSPRPQTD